MTEVSAVDMIELWEDTIIPEMMVGDYGFTRSGTTRFIRDDLDAYVGVIHVPRSGGNHAYIHVLLPLHGGDLVFNITLADSDGNFRDWREVAYDFYQVVGPLLSVPETITMDVEA